jgi:type 1 fimbriae regulatory protein FimB/type 1 fimbriae regulatory protein FimE
MISYTDSNNSKRLIHMANTHLQLVAPTNKKRTVTPQRRPNTDYRTREYLTEVEVEKLITAAGDNRHGHRDATIILVAFRHGLRASELVGLRWDQIDFEGGVLHVARRKRGTPSTQPIFGRELRALRRLKREAQVQSPFAFVSERGAPFSVAGFQKLVARAGVTAGFAFQLHPHMLRHSCGFKLANDGVDTRSLQGYLGHRSIQHTVRYTELAPGRFKGFWKD